MEEIQNFLNIVTTQLNKQFKSFNIDLEANLMDLLNVLNILQIPLHYNVINIVMQKN